MKFTTRKSFCFLASMALLLSFQACQEEPELEGGDLPGIKASNSITFAVGGSSIVTKGAEEGHAAVIRDLIPFSVEEGETPLYLEESVIDLDDVYYPSEQVTKGIPSYTETFGTTYYSFGAKTYSYSSVVTADKVGADAEGSALTLFTGGKSNSFNLVSAADAKPLQYSYDFADGHWPQTGVDNLLFFMSAPDMVKVSPTSTSPIDGVTAINYKYSKAGDKYNGIIEFDYTSPAEAEDQIDILFTSKSIDKASYDLFKDGKATYDNASVLFYHTLAGVKFKWGNKVTTYNNGTYGFESDGLTITKIELTNIINKGTCTVTPVYDSEGYNVKEDESNTGIEGSSSTKKSRSVSLWERENSTADFSLEPTGHYSAGESQFPVSFYGGDNKLGDDNYLTDGTFKDVFFFIPQTTSSDTKLTVTYTLAGEATGVTHTKTIDFSNHVWYAGELYTYVLTVKDLAVGIDDDMTDASGNESDTPDTKSNLQISNTRNTPAYLRVALSGNWFDNSASTPGQPSNVIVNHDWDDGIVYNDTDWFLASDGFWYYKYQVKGGVTIPSERTLFDTYTVGESAKADTHLEITIALQGVDASKKGTTDWPWPADATAELEDKLEDGTQVFPLSSTTSN